MISTILAFLKRETVLCAALLLALVSTIAAKPTLPHCLSYIDFRVLVLLFCFMALIQAFKSIQVLDDAAQLVLSKCTTPLAVSFSLTAAVFFFSMIVTNDAALLTVVPLTLVLCRKANIPAAHLVVFETLAANLGSCMTPMGNPQNLFLYSYYNMTPALFFSSVATIGIPSLLLLTAVLLFHAHRMPSGKTLCAGTQPDMQPGENAPTHPAIKAKPAKAAAYTVGLIIALAAVFRVIDCKIMLACIVCIVLVCNYRVFASVDYSLLCTFCGFFIFTGNLTSLTAVSALLENLLATPFSTYCTGILASQIISNVPAALLLSGFTDSARELLLAVNTGGLGTLTASLASLISYKLYRADALQQADAQHRTDALEQTDISHRNKPAAGNAPAARTPSYILLFTVYNLFFLAVLAPLVWFLRLI